MTEAAPQVARVGEEDTRGLESFRRLFSEYEESLPADLRIPDVRAELESLPERYAAPGAAMFLAFEGDDAIGCVAVKTLDDDTAELKRLYVAPAARRSGAGRALVEAAIAFARERKYRRVVLDTERERLNGAYRLYQSLGFRVCEPYAAAEYANPTFMELLF